MSADIHLNFSHVSFTRDGLYAAPYSQHQNNKITLSIHGLTDKGFIQIEPISTVLSTKQRIQDLYGLPPNQQILIFNGHELQDSETLISKNIKDGDTLHLSMRLQGGVGPSIGFEFSNLEKQKMLNLRSPDSTTPMWEIVQKGLNLEGKCENHKCDLYRKQIWIQKGFGRFDIARMIYEINCPSCTKQIEVNNVGFWDCKYVVDGMQKEPESKKVHQESIAPKEKLATFLPDRIKWAYLNIETKNNASCTII